jgi:hypothetical protein
MNKIEYITWDQFVFYLASNLEQSVKKGKTDYTIFNKNSFYVPYCISEKCNGSLFCVINPFDSNFSKMPFNFIENMAMDLLIPSSEFYSIVRCFDLVEENISDPYEERSERIYSCASLEDIFNVIKDSAKMPSNLLPSYNDYRIKKDTFLNGAIEKINNRLKNSILEEYYKIEITKDSLTYQLFNRKYFQLKNIWKPDIFSLFYDFDLLLKTQAFSNVEKGKVVFNDIFDFQNILT